MDKEQLSEVRRKAAEARWSKPGARAEQKQKIGRAWLPERRAAFSEKMRGVLSSPEMRAKFSAAQKTNWEQPERREKGSRALRAYHATQWDEAVLDHVAPADWIYYAGLWDGEGSIQAKRDSRRLNTQCRITLVMGSVVVEEMAGQFGLKAHWVSMAHKTQVNGRPYADMWRFEASGSRAVAILKRLLPFLRVKKREAQAAVGAG